MKKFLLSELCEENISQIIEELYQETSENEEQYPNYKKWFYETNLPRVFSKKGEIIFYRDAFQIAGLSILKKDNQESKICTFKIHHTYKKTGLSRKLLEDSFDYLETAKPLITIPQNKLLEFSKIIEDYNWVLIGSTNQYKTLEYIFNDFSYKK